MDIKFDKKRYKSVDEVVEEIQKIKQFGEELGLVYNGAFSEIVDEESQLCFFVYASYQNEIRSIFDSVSYEYFHGDRSAAVARDKELVKKGYDTYFFESNAYQGNNCQIAPSLIDETLESRTDLIFHEGFHNYVEKNEIKLPIKLEESIASYVGYKGALVYFKENDPLMIPEVESDHDEWKIRVEYANRIYALLESSYETSGICREIIFKMAENLYSKLFGVSKIINNAYFLRANEYTGHYNLVFDTINKVSIKEYLKNPNEINGFLIAQTNKQ